MFKHLILLKHNNANRFVNNISRRFIYINNSIFLITKYIHCYKTQLLKLFTDNDIKL